MEKERELVSEFFGEVTICSLKLDVMWKLNNMKQSKSGEFLSSDLRELSMVAVTKTKKC